MLLQERLGQQRAGDQPEVVASAASWPDQIAAHHQAQPAEQTSLPPLLQNCWSWETLIPMQVQAQPPLSLLVERQFQEQMPRIP